MDISPAALIGWVSLSLGTVAAVGIWPTWRLLGPAGIQAAWLAGLIILPLMVLSAILTIYAAGKGAAWAAFAFAATGVVRMVLSFLFGALVLWYQLAETLPLVAWMIGLYVAVLAAESIWLSRALNQDAHRRALEGAGPRVGWEAMG